MDNSRNSKLAMAAVFGAGAVVGVISTMGISGAYMHYKLEKTMGKKFEEFSENFKELIEEMKDLKTPSVLKKKKIRFSNHSSSDNADGYLTHGTTSSGDEEFYDLPDSENIMSFQGEDFTEFIKRVDELLTGNPTDKENAYQKLYEKENTFDNNPEFMWRYAKSIHLRSVRFGQEEPDLKREAAFFAKDIAEKALEMNPNHSEIQKWYAITLGSIGDYLSTTERISNGYKFKQHIDIAATISPDDFTLYHLLGRWCYQVYMLTWYERTAAKSLFGEPPSATAEEALENFFQAEKLNPSPWKENKLYIAKTYIGKYEYTQAIKWLDEAIDLPQDTDAEIEAHKEVVELHNQYQSYRR